MAVVKRHWKGLFTNLVTFAVVGLIFYFYQSNHKARGGDAQQPPAGTTATATTLDAMTYSQVSALRRELALTDGDLAAMGLTQATAEQVLSSTLKWYQDNKPQLDQANLQVSQAQWTLQDTVQKIHMGPRDESLISQVPTLKQQVVAQQAARAQLLQGLIAQAGSALDANQSTIWQTARANLAAPARYRYVPNLSSDQAQTLEVALYKSPTGIPGVADTENATLNAMAQNAMATAQANAQQAWAGVQAAEAKVLPVPPELLPADPNTPSPSPAPVPSQ